jgi:hypothetical protein
MRRTRKTEAFDSATQKYDRLPPASILNQSEKSHLDTWRPKLRT